MSERTITDADAKAIAEYVHELHVCRFKEVTPADMSFLIDLLSLYKETRSEIIKWVVRGIVYGSLLLLSIGAYFKFRGAK